MTPERYRSSVKYAAAHGWPDAVRIQAEDKASQARKRVKAAPRLKSEEEESVKKDDAHVALVRKVMARPGFVCELGEHDTDEGIDPHHLEKGQNKTRNERLSNMIRACRAHHDAEGMNEATFVPAVLRWCDMHGYPLPNRKVYRRLPPASTKETTRD